jgi:hypothetical protein
VHSYWATETAALARPRHDADNDGAAGEIVPQRLVPSLWRATLSQLVADAELVCYVLADTPFQELKARRPDIALELVTNLAREMTSRRRRATRTIFHLAS